MYSKVILTGLMATAVSASANFMAHAEMKREVLQPRQTDVTGGISTECQTALLEVYSSLPSPPPEILSDAIENPQTDPCSFSTPASLADEYSSYSAEVVSWYAENEDEINSVLEACPILSQYATMVPVCPTDLGGAGGGAGASSTAAPRSNDASATEDVSTATDDADSTATDDVDSTATDEAESSATGGANTLVTSRTSGSGSGASTTGTAAVATETTTTPNGAHREGAMAVAAIAVAGFVIAAL